MNNVTFLSTDAGRTAGRLRDFIFCPMHMHSIGQTIEHLFYVSPIFTDRQVDWLTLSAISLPTNLILRLVGHKSVTLTIQANPHSVTLYVSSPAG